MVVNKITDNRIESNTLFNIKEWFIVCQVDTNWFNYNAKLNFKSHHLLNSSTKYIISNKYVFEMCGRFFCKIDDKIYLVEKKIK